jgi:hypothetical protein
MLGHRARLACGGIWRGSVVEDRRAGGWPLSLRRAACSLRRWQRCTQAPPWTLAGGIGVLCGRALAIGASGCGAIDGHACNLVKAGGRDALP